MESPKNYPAFMKAYFPPGSTQSLNLPSPFTSVLKGSLPNEVMLRNKNGKIWVVEVAKLGDNLLFQAGWPKFIAENVLQWGDILVFEYDGKNRFDFKILGETATNEEIRQAFDFSSKWGQEDEQVVEESDDNEKIGSQDQEDQDTQELEEKTDSTKALMIQEEYAKGNISAKSNPLIDDAAFPSEEVNPYFISRVLKDKLNEVYVPREFFKSFEVELPETMMIVDQNGNEYLTETKTRCDGRLILQGGWKHVFASNQIEVNDSFVCEFIRDDHKGTYIKVVNHWKDRYTKVIASQRCEVKKTKKI